MEDPIFFIADFQIGDPSAWRPAIERMAAFVVSNVPRARSFHAYTDATGTEGTVIYAHPDAASLDQHLEAAADMIRAGSELVQVRAIELLGPARPETIEQLRASGTKVVARPAHVAGFDR